MNQRGKHGAVAGWTALTAVALAAALAAGMSALGRETIRVIDGDTLALRRWPLPEHRVRLWGIDAPERHQWCTDADGESYACGAKATRLLRDLIGDREVRCDYRSRDRYGRDVARCWTLGLDLGREMVRAGWAVDFSRYSGGYYLPSEMSAALRGAGMWAGRFERPEEYRRHEREWERGLTSPSRRGNVVP